MIDNEFEQLLKKLEEMLPGKQAADDLHLLKNCGISSIDEMVDKLKDASTQKEIRLVICWALGRTNLVKSTGALLDTAEDKDPDIRAEAAKSLGSQGKKEGVPLLIHLMMHDDILEVRKSSAYALGVIGDLRALDMLVLKLFDQNEASEVRGIAAEALGDLGDRFAVEPLIRALNQNPGEVKFWIVNSLGRLGKTEALAPLKKLIQELKEGNDLPLKREAAEAVKKIEEINQNQ